MEVSTTTASTLEQGLCCQRAGNLTGARAAYQAILRHQPSHARALYLLGMTYAQAGEFEKAIPPLREALAARPDYFDALLHLGSALMETKREEEQIEALALLHQAACLRPENGNAHYALANAQRERGLLQEAACSYRLAVQRIPDLVPAHNNLGNTLLDLGEYKTAVDCLRRAVMLAPSEWRVHASLSGCLHTLGRLEEAASACRQAIRLMPDNAALHANLSKILWSQGKQEEARECLRCVLTDPKQDVETLLTLGNAFHALNDYRHAESCLHRALALAPQRAEVHALLGVVYWTLGRLEQAEEYLCAALSLQPDHLQAHLHLSKVLNALNRLEEAKRHLDCVLDTSPDHVEANCLLGQWFLKQGDYTRGWKHYDHIHRMDISTPRRFPQPRWNGSDLNGRTLLIHTQFGLGDTLQFVRYLPLITKQIKEKGGRVLLECQWELAALLQGSDCCAGVDQIIARTPAMGNRLPDAPFDVQFNLMSLPALFGSEDSTLPHAVPYIQPPDDLSALWQARLQTVSGFKIGIVWAASTEGLRSCAALDFLSLAELPSVSLISLQKGLEAAQTTSLAAKAPLHDLAPEIKTFADTAAIAAHLDLIITVDTSVAHLAGAMNKPVWTLLPYGADWRWQMDREETPWYPSMRLFRQPRPGDWAGVFEKALACLQQIGSSGYQGATG